MDIRLMTALKPAADALARPRPAAAPSPVSRPPTGDPPPKVDNGLRPEATRDEQKTPAETLDRAKAPDRATDRALERGSPDPTTDPDPAQAVALLAETLAGYGLGTAQAADAGVEPVASLRQAIQAAPIPASIKEVFLGMVDVASGAPAPAADLIGLGRPVPTPVPPVPGRPLPYSEAVGPELPVPSPTSVEVPEPAILPRPTSDPASQVPVPSLGRPEPVPVPNPTPAPAILPRPTMGDPNGLLASSGPQATGQTLDAETVAALNPVSVTVETAAPVPVDIRPASRREAPEPRLMPSAVTETPEPSPVPNPRPVPAADTVPTPGPTPVPGSPASASAIPGIAMTATPREMQPGRPVPAPPVATSTTESEPVPAPRQAKGEQRPLPPIGPGVPRPVLDGPVPRPTPNPKGDFQTLLEVPVTESEAPTPGIVPSPSAPPTEAPKARSTTETPAPTTQALARETANAVVRQVADRIETMVVARQSGNVTVRLEPADLGTITMTVKSMGQRIDAEVSASEDSVRAALAANRQDLVQSIESRGLTLNSFSVGAETNADARGQQFASYREAQGEAVRTAVMGSLFGDGRRDEPTPRTLATRSMSLVEVFA